MSLAFTPATRPSHTRELLHSDLVSRPAHLMEFQRKGGKVGMTFDSSDIAAATTLSRSSLSTTPALACTSTPAAPDPLFDGYHRADMHSVVTPVHGDSSAQSMGAVHNAPQSPRGPGDPCPSVKSPSLMRRFSRGAQQRLRPRISGNNVKSRDHSSGPVVIRRRSRSRSMPDGQYELSDLELDNEEEELVRGNGSPSVNISGSPPRHSLTSSDIPSQATTFVKITRKKKKNLKFYLDQSAAKIYWSGAFSSSRKQIYVDDIKELRAGDRARHYLDEFQIPGNTLSRWLTILYLDPDRSKGRLMKSLHLLAPSEEIRTQWMSSLQYMMKTRDDLMADLAGHRERPREAHWMREMAKKFGPFPHEEEETMDFAAIKRTCRSFSINKSEHDLREHFDRLDTRKTGALTFLQYLEFFRKLTERSDVRRLFDLVKNPRQALMSLECFLHFLEADQGVDVASDRLYWQTLFEKLAIKGQGLGLGLATVEDGFQSRGITCESFRDFLLSGANSALVGQRSEPMLSHHLNEYFISSSHNTYLMGRQVGGQSSAEGYIAALKKGCRCIEIDCWDGDDGKPRVTHGRTFSTSVSFLECIKAINQYAFWASKYPLIISLEVHCNPEQQKLMAETMKEHFGTQLLLAPVQLESRNLPSPEALKNKILIKVKEPKKEEIDPPDATSTPSHRRQRSASAPDPRTLMKIKSETLVQTSLNPPLPLSPFLRSATFTTPQFERMSIGSTTTSVSSSNSDESDSPGSPTRKTKPKTSNIVSVLGDMGVYTRGMGFSDFRSSQSKKYNHVYSFKETTFEDKCKTPEMKALLEKHNSRYLMRVYPKGSRVNSSNFDPLQFWRRGVQMVATNWQTYDLGTQINDAMFAAGSDRTGYVLKPADLRRSKDEFPESLRKPRKRIVKFLIDIISAQYLEAPPDLRDGDEMNPYIEFELYSAEDKVKGMANGKAGTTAATRNGVSGMGSSFRRRTRIVEGNGYDPLFDEPIVMTLETKYPSLVFVRWTVWNSPDGRNPSSSREPLSSFTAKLSSLQEGYRHLPLNNKHGEPLISKVFCRIRKEDHRDVEARPDDAISTTESSKHNSEDGAKSGKDFLRRVFNRTPSERKRQQGQSDSGCISRATSWKSDVS